MSNIYRIILLVSLILIIVAIIYMWSEAKEMESAEALTKFNHVLTPIFAILNVIIILYITFLNIEFGSKQAKANLQTNKQIAITNLKFDEFKSYKNVMDKHVSHWANQWNDKHRLNEIITNHILLTERLSYIFPKMYLLESGKEFQKLLIEANDLPELKSLGDEKCALTIMNYNDFVKDFGLMVIDSKEEGAA